MKAGQLSAIRVVVIVALAIWICRGRPGRCGREGRPLSVRRLSRHSQLSGIRRSGHSGVRHRQRPQVRQAHRDARQPRGEAGQHQGRVRCAATQRLYFTTTKKLYCVDLATEKTLWEKSPPNGTDRMSITPDGKIIYVPSFEKDTWNVIDAATGELITSIETKSGAHNTVVSRDGQRMYLGGLKSPLLFVADTKTHEIVQKVGPFAGAIRPFTVNGAQHAGLCLRQ